MAAAAARTGADRANPSGKRTRICIAIPSFPPDPRPRVMGKVARQRAGVLTARYQERYYHVSGVLYQQDTKAVAAVRAIARRELPNLLAAVNGALDTGTPWAVDFVNKANTFLGFFGLSRDRAALAKKGAGCGRRAGLGRLVPRSLRSWRAALCGGQYS